MRLHLHMSCFSHLARALLPALLATTPVGAGFLDEAPEGYAWGATETRHVDMVPNARGGPPRSYPARVRAVP